MSVTRYYCCGIEDPSEEYCMPQGEYVRAEDYDRAGAAIKEVVREMDAATEFLRGVIGNFVADLVAAWVVDLEKAMDTFNMTMGEARAE
jgi:hypothetical protein